MRKHLTGIVREDVLTVVRGIEMDVDVGIEKILEDKKVKRK